MMMLMCKECIIKQNAHNVGEHGIQARCAVCNELHICFEI